MDVRQEIGESLEYPIRVCLDSRLFVALILGNTSLFWQSRF